MEWIVSQVFVGVLLLSLGYLVFRKFKFTLSIYHITLCALMIAISTVLQLYSMTIPLFGFPSLKVGFGQLPIMVLGILLNPAYAFFVGIVKDVVGLIIAPSGPPYLGFTLNTVLVGVIPAYCYHFLKDVPYQQLRKVVALAMIGLCSLSAFMIVNPQLLGIASFKIAWEIKTVLILLLLGIVVFLLRLVQTKKDVLFLIYALSVFLVEVLVNFISTPIYLKIMYQIPVWGSIMARLFKAGFMFPITLLVGYYVLKTVLRIKRNKE